MDFGYLDAMALELWSSGLVDNFEKVRALLFNFWEDKVSIVLDSSMVQKIIKNPEFSLSNKDALLVLKEVVRHHDLNNEISPDTIHIFLDAMLRRGAIKLIQSPRTKEDYWEDGNGGRLLIRRGKFILVRRGATEFKVYESPSYAWEFFGDADYGETFQSIGAAIENLKLRSRRGY